MIKGTVQRKNFTIFGRPIKRHGVE